MCTLNENREACATIKGYLYQFDATIISILELKQTDSIVIEGIEDFDIFRVDLSEFFQCKYYEATKLTPATIRDAIQPMLKNFLRLDKTAHTKQSFHLYGFFKDSIPDTKKLSPDELKKSLIRREHSTANGRKHMEIIDVQKELGASDQDIVDFSSRLTIHITEDFTAHKSKVIEALRNNCGTTSHEAESFLYPSARTFVSDTAANSNPIMRRVTRSGFISQISPSRAAYCAWSLRENGEKAYCTIIRRDHFCERNIDPAYRVFIIDSSLSTSDTELFSICFTLRQKWSSYDIRRKPEKERYAPFVYFRGLPTDRLVSLKTLLHDSGVRFVDGYPFHGSAFSIDHLLSQQTYSNQLSLRFLSSLDDFNSSMSSIRGRLFVYDFFKDLPIEINKPCTQISIPVKSIRMIENII